MSTWLYLQCDSHNPPLRAEGESGQHLYDLPQIQQDYATRAVLIGAYDATDGLLDLGHWFRNNTVRFLALHRHCNVSLWDEYGRPHPLEEAPE